MKLLIQDHADDEDIEALKGRISARNPGSYWVDIPGGWELRTDDANFNRITLGFEDMLSADQIPMTRQDAS